MNIYEPIQADDNDARVYLHLFDCIASDRQLPGFRLNYERFIYWTTRVKKEVTRWGADEAY